MQTCGELEFYTPHKPLLMKMNKKKITMTYLNILYMYNITTMEQN